MSDTVRYDDSQFINTETISLFANTNEAFLVGSVNGIVLEFPGLGGGSCLGGSMDRGAYASDFAKDFAKNGIVLAYLFPGPWSWGNKGAVRMADAVVTALIKKYNLQDGFPLAACGGSMGGVGCLLYAADSAYTVTAVASACPCIDIIDRIDSNLDFPRTIICAASCYDMPIMNALERISPLARINDMPDIPYFICSDGVDEVFPQAQCDQYVHLLKNKRYNVEYMSQPNLRHGEFIPEVRLRLHAFLKEQIL